MSDDVQKNQEDMNKEEEALSGDLWDALDSANSEEAEAAAEAAALDGKKENLKNKKAARADKFSSFCQHFFDFMSINFIYLIFNIPAMLVAFFFSLFFMPQISTMLVKENFTGFLIDSGLLDAATAATEAAASEIDQIYYVIIMIFALLLLGLGLICVGPFQAGFCQIFRNMYRKTGYSIFSDFKQGVKENWKQSLPTMLVSLAVTALLLYGIGYYIHHFGKVGVVLATILAIILVVFSIVQNIVYFMMVSVSLPLGKHYSNAIKLFLIEIFPCIGLAGLALVIFLFIPFLLYFVVTGIGSAIAIVLYLTFSFGFMQYLYSVLCGNMVAKYVAKKPEATESTQEKDTQENDD